MKKSVISVSFIAMLTMGIAAFPISSEATSTNETTQMSDSSAALGTETATSANEEISGTSIGKAGEFLDELKDAHDQCVARQDQILQDLKDARERREKRLEDLHNDFEQLQDQLDQNHSDFQDHVTEAQDRLEADHAAIEDAWDQGVTQLDQARDKVAQKSDEVKKLGEALQADGDKLASDLSSLKEEGQQVKEQLTAGTTSNNGDGVTIDDQAMGTEEDSSGTTSDAIDRAGDLDGAVSRIKGILDSAGSDLSPTAEATPVKVVNTASPAQKQDSGTQTLAQYPKTGEQRQPLLTLLGVGIAGIAGGFWLFRHRQ